MGVRTAPDNVLSEEQVANGKTVHIQIVGQLSEERNEVRQVTHWAADGVARFSKQPSNANPPRVFSKNVELDVDERRP